MKGNLPLLTVTIMIFSTEAVKKEQRREPHQRNQNRCKKLLKLGKLPLFKGILRKTLNIFVRLKRQLFFINSSQTDKRTTTFSCTPTVWMSPMKKDLSH